MLDLRPVVPSLLSTIIRAILDKPHFAVKGARLRVITATADCHRGPDAAQVVWIIELKWEVGGCLLTCTKTREADLGGSGEEDFFFGEAFKLGVCVCIDGAAAAGYGDVTRRWWW